MPFVLSIAWRLLLAVALVASPILGLASEGGCAHASMPTKHTDVAHAKAHAAADAMPGCTHMADMAGKASQGKPAPGKHDPSRGIPSGHAGCTSSACCLGGAVSMTGLAISLNAQPLHEAPTAFHDALAPTPPSGRMLRPPIA
jgi:hypothetical protein